MQGLCGSHSDALAGNLQEAMLAQEMFVGWWEALSWCEADAARPYCSALLSGSTAIPCLLGHLPFLKHHLPWVPHQLWDVPHRLGCIVKDCWVSSSNWLLFTSLMAHSHMPHWSGKDFHWLAQLSGGKPSCFWLGGFQPSKRALGRVQR